MGHGKIVLVVPGCMVVISSSCQALAVTIPMTLTPRPKWASAVEKADLGKPTSRFQLVLSGIRPIPARSISSAMAPNATHTPSSSPSGASEIEPPLRAKISMVTNTVSPATQASRCVTATRSPRFQAMNGPKGSTINNGAITAPNVSAKNGAPTEMVLPVVASSRSG